MEHYIKELRESTNLTQKDFANKFSIPLSTLRKWEQGESKPPIYVVRLIENSLPSYRREYEVYIGSKGEKYYLDKINKRVGDSLGNWIPFYESINGVLKENISFYIENLFKSFNAIKEKFDNDLKLDKIDKIIWR